MKWKPFWVKVIGVMSTLAVLASLLFVLAKAQLADSPKSMWRYGVRHLGLSSYPIPTAKPPQFWKFSVANQTTNAGTFPSSPSIGVDDTIYVGLNNALYAVNPDGSEKWHVILDDDGDVIRSIPAIDGNGTDASDDDVIYVSVMNDDSDDSGVYAIRASDGIILGEDGVCHHTAKGGPLLVNRNGQDWLYSSCGSRVYAWTLTKTFSGGEVSSVSFTEQWNTSLGGSVWGSPVYDADHDAIIAGSDSDGVFSLDASSGGQNWQFTAGDRVQSSPAIQGGRVYIGSHDGHLYALDSSNGNQIWAFNAGDDVRSSPAVYVSGSETIIYFATYNSSASYLYALDENGAQLWSALLGRNVMASPVIDSGGHVIILTHDSQIFVFDKDGNLLWEIDPSSDAGYDDAGDVEGEIAIDSCSNLYVLGGYRSGRNGYLIAYGDGPCSQPTPTPTATFTPTPTATFTPTPTATFTPTPTATFTPTPTATFTPTPTATFTPTPTATFTPTPTATFTPTPTATFTPTPTATFTPTPTATFTPTPTATFTPTPTATFTPTPTATFTPTPIPTPTLGPFDPPQGIKVGLSEGWPIVEWRQVWLNPNGVALNAQILDPLASGTAYITGSLSCEAYGVSVTTRCDYDAANNQIIWEGTIGPDAGATSEEDAINKVVITFRVRVYTDTEVGNTATAYWTDVPTPTRSHARAIVKPPRLPKTGFAPGVITWLPSQTVTYRALGPLWLDIPRLGVQVPIVGVPHNTNGWDLTWLWDQAGWLEGTAFPTWIGNTVLTAHNYLSTGLPGPFAHLYELRWGDKVVIHAYGHRYIYEVRVVRLVEPNDTSVLSHKEYDWVTLITCEGYDEATNIYHWRLVVQAVLVKVEPDD